MAKSRLPNIPTTLLAGDEEKRYVQQVVRVLRRARLNAQYPTARRLAAHIEALGPAYHHGLYPGVRVDRRSGLPAYPEWVRVKTDLEVAPGALADIPARTVLEPRARAEPSSIHAKRLLKRAYYEKLVALPASLAALSDLDVALRRVEPEKNLAHFHVVFDKLEATGLMVRYTVDLAQRDSVWNRPLVTLNEDFAGHTEDLKALIFRFTALEAELAFAKLASQPGLVLERVVKGAVGPIFFHGMDAPAALREMLGDPEAFIASFSLDMAACDLQADRDNDPLDDLLADRLSQDGRAGYDAARARWGYRVFKDRKFVVPQPLQQPMAEFCGRHKTRNIIYAVGV